MAKKSESKGFGIAALILGIIGFGLAWIPVVNLFFIPLGILALIFGIVAIVKTTAKGLGIAGTILGGAIIIITIIMNVVVGAWVMNEANNSLNQYNNELNELNRLLENY